MPLVACHQPFFSVAAAVVASLGQFHLFFVAAALVTWSPFFGKIVAAQAVNLFVGAMLAVVFGGRVAGTECSFADGGVAAPHATFPALEWQLTALIMVLTFHSPWNVMPMYYRALALAVVWLATAAAASFWFYSPWVVLASSAIGALLGVVAVHTLLRTEFAATAGDPDADHDGAPLKDTAV